MDDVWVTANFKETQFKKMRPGQPVTIHLDSYDRDYRGRLDAIGGATGSRFSLLSPGENSDQLFRPGMSVEARVKFR
jgi:membrane fusion protein (multidrug efflux system)